MRKVLRNLRLDNRPNGSLMFDRGRWVCWFFRCDVAARQGVCDLRGCYVEVPALLLACRETPPEVYRAIRLVAVG